MQKESIAQRAIIKCCMLEKIKIVAIPNGGKRNAKEAYFLKLEGVSAGFPDLFVAEMCSGYGGLFIELKIGKNKPTESQKEWIEYLNKAGYLAVVCYGHQEAMDTIHEYLNLKSNSKKTTV